MMAESSSEIRNGISTVAKIDGAYGTDTDDEYFDGHGHDADAGSNAGDDTHDDAYDNIDDDPDDDSDEGGTRF